MRDPYSVLGVSRTASQDEIKRAYRRLARTLHPDLNPGDPKAEEKFKEASAAYDLLADADKRRRFDRGEINADGTEKPFARGAHGGFGQGFGGGGFRGGFRGARTSGGGSFSFEDIFGAGGPGGDEDIFSDLFRSASRGPGGRHRTAPQRGPDKRYRLHVTFEDAALGTTRTLPLAGGRKVNVKVPPGCAEGHVLRLKGMGGPGLHGGTDGDALVEVHIKPHPVFRREGNDVIADIPISLHEAVLGAKITVPTVDGKVQVTVPEGSNTGTVLRLRGKGIPGEDGKRGDQLCKLRLVLEDPKDPKLKSFVKKWTPAGTSPRAKLDL